MSSLFFPPSLCDKGLGNGPRFPRTAFLFSCRGHSRSYKVLPALLQRSQWTNNSFLRPPLGRSTGTQRVGFALGTVGLPSPLSWQLVEMYRSERPIVKSTALDGGSKGLIASFTALTFTQNNGLSHISIGIFEASLSLLALLAKYRESVSFFKLAWRGWFARIWISGENPAVGLKRNLKIFPSWSCTQTMVNNISEGCLCLSTSIEVGSFVINYYCVYNSDMLKWYISTIFQVLLAESILYHMVVLLCTLLWLLQTLANEWQIYIHIMSAGNILQP